MSTTHTLSVLVENKPGVLSRVSGLFSRRGFNINSLAVGPTDTTRSRGSRSSVTVEGTALEQVTKQLNKLVNVIKIVELEEKQSVQRELLLVKVRADAATRPRRPRDRRALPGQGGRCRRSRRSLSRQTGTLVTSWRHWCRVLEPYGIRVLAELSWSRSPAARAP